MIELPRNFSAPITSPSQPGRMVRFQAISDEEKKVQVVERRLSPTRRGPSSTKQQIERRVSSDRRRLGFSSKV